MSSFRKQFQRVRQNIDQNLGRAEKTEVLTEDELNLERRVDLVKNICQNVQKKIQPCLRSLGQNTDPEKRMKKLPEVGLSHTMIECSVQLDQNTPVGNIFSLGGDVQGKLAQEIFKLEVDIENKILKPYQNILDIDYPSVQRLRKQLNTKTLDMDAAKSRYQSVMKQVQSGAVPQTKGDEVRNDMDEAITKVEQVKDQWATEMYTFSGKEIEICQSILELIQVQADFHRRSLELLEGYLPQISQNLILAVKKPVFGLRLEEHLETRPGEISMVIEECVRFLCGLGLEEEGLLRLTGPASKIKKLKSAFNCNMSTNLLMDSAEDYDVHTVACSLKQYLRELPEPLMKSDLFCDWTKALEKPPEQVANHLKEVASRLEPKEYYINLRYVVKFLSKLSEFSDINKMTASNIGVVMGPNLIWPSSDSAGPNMLAVGLQSALVEALVNHCDAVFPGASEFDDMYTKVQCSPLPPFDVGSKIFVPPATIPEVKVCVGDVPGTSTLRKAKKQPAPQPPSQEGITFPHMFPSNNTHHHDHSPTPRVEKPRVPPPERPNIPPPDKPQVAERPKATPPSVPVLQCPPATLQSTSPPVNYSVLSAITQPSQQPPPPPPSTSTSMQCNSSAYPYQSQSQSTYPYMPQSSHSPQPSPYPYQPVIAYPYQPQTNLPYQPQPDVSNNIMSASMSSISQPSGARVVSNSTSTSCISSDSLPVTLNNASNSRLYPNLEPGEMPSNGSIPKGHVRQLSTGSRPVPPQRPHPPVPPKKADMKSTDF